ncbi:MAG TPA: hypothetical protein PLP31_13670 [Thermoanaerobaculaceae bacterium]|nr:hypothetical protein [Thermoanaerobaculaceae bacterium]
MRDEGTVPPAAEEGEQGQISPRAENALFALALALTLALLTYRVADFPIYFFCDEATPVNLAADLIENGFRASDGVLFPPYFQNVDKYSLSLNVYVHVLPVALFGRSVVVARVTSALIALLGAAAAGLALRAGFRSCLWWTAPLVLAAMPAFLLHGRTAFETVMSTAFLAVFLWAYLHYRLGAPRFLLLALAAGAATFYAYANGQGIAVFLAVALLLADAPYHARTLRARPGLAASAALLALLLAAPYVRFRVLHPNAVEVHLKTLESAVTHSRRPASERVRTYLGNLVQGLSPTYWFLPNEVDLERHRMKGHGHAPAWLLPFAAAALVASLRRIRSPGSRTLLLAVPAVVFSPAIAGIEITRVLAMVVPIALLSVLGMDLLAGLARRLLPWRGTTRATAAVAIAGLAGWCTWLLGDALGNGPSWFPNAYGLYSLQYGQRQVFGAIRKELLADPDVRVGLSPNWTNNGDAFKAFFLEPDLAGRVSFLDLEGMRASHAAPPEDALVVLMQVEREELARDPRFQLDPPSLVLPYPDGRPGFAFLRMRLTEVGKAAMVKTEAERALPVDGTVQIGGEEVAVRYSRLDMGAIQELFDGEPETLVRTADADPFLVELAFLAPRRCAGVVVRLWWTCYDVTVTALPAGGGAPLTVRREVRAVDPDPVLTVRLPSAVPLEKLRLEISNHEGDRHVHVREVELLPAPAPEGR